MKVQTCNGLFMRLISLSHTTKYVGIKGLFNMSRIRSILVFEKDREVSKKSKREVEGGERRIQK